MTILFMSINTWSQTITKEGGWLESAFVEWTAPVGGADSYNVYYTGGGKNNQAIDTQLIRSYGTYFRADVLGLAAGSYTITVKPVKSGIEGAGVTTTSITVVAHDRNGFAFEGGRIPGGYNMDGTPKSGAVILYITKNTKNTISATVTGATTNPCVGLQNILYGIKKGKDTRPYIIRLIGNITDMTVMEGGDITIENAINPSSSLTIEGVGDDAVVNGMGVRLKSATNIEVRNLGFMNCNSTAGDNIGMQQDNDHIWVHNNDLFYGNAGSDADQIKGDGALDNKNSSFITMSYNHFWDSGKASLLGLSEGSPAGLYVTYHHNWFDHSDSRHPRVRYYSTHIYNNYFDGNSKYGSGSTLGSSLFIEGNYFRNAKHPMMTSMQGTDIWDETKQINDEANMGTFSKEAGGTIKEFNNKFDADIATNNMRFVAYGDLNPLYNIAGKISSLTDFDAYSAQTRDEQVPATVISKVGGNKYNNFDTDPALYVKNLVIQSPDEAKAETMLHAGRVSGGDLKWTFNNAVEDKNYIVIDGLKSALTNYTSKMVAVQGETAPVGNQTLVATTNNNNQTVSAGVAIANIVFTWGGDATDANVTAVDSNGDPIVGLNGIVVTKNTTAKTLTLSGVPTALVDYTVSTSGSLGISSSDSGTITVLPPSSQTLAVTSGSANQSVLKDKAITPIVLTWGGDATDANVTGLADGLISAKDTDAKTITISGTPTAVGTSTYTITTTGSVGTPVAVSGTITVNAVPVGNIIHNYTLSGTASDFYTFAGSEKSGPVATTYDNLSLTRAHKMDSAGKVTYTTTAVSTLTLVILQKTTATIKLNNTVYSIPSNGVIVIDNVPAGLNTIVQGSGESHLYYLKTSYSTLGLNDNNSKTPKLTVYPNPVTDRLNISNVASQTIKNVTIYSITGSVVKTIANPSDSIDVSNLNSGNYLVKVTTDQGTTTQKIIKK